MYVEDIEAKIKMEVDAAKEDRPFNSLSVNNVSLIEDLTDKLTFLTECQNLGFKVPDFKVRK